MSRYRVALFGLLLPALSYSPSHAACSWTTIANGTTADATKVMDNFDCLAPLASPQFTGQAGISYYFGGISIGSTNTTDDAIEIAGSGNVGIKFRNVFDGGGAWRQLAGVDAASNLTLLYFDGSSQIRRLTLQGGTGNVGIGTAFPAYTLEVNGSVAGTSAYVNLSDVRLKKNIRPMRDAIGMVDRLRGIMFDWKDKKERSIGKAVNLPVGQPQIGFIAQEVQKVLPEAVTVANDKDGTMSVAESKIVPVLVEAVKQLDAQNRKLAAELSAQGKEMSKLKSKVASLATKAASRLASAQP